MKKILHNWSISTANPVCRHHRITASSMIINALARREPLTLNNLRLGNLPDIFSLPETMDLKHITLAQCHLAALPPSLFQHPNMEQLTVTGNPVEALPNTVQLPKLEKLCVSNNRLRTLPDNLSGLSNLTHLLAGGNQLTALPENLCELVKLTHLFLGGNLLTELPTNIYRLVNLKHLFVGENRLITLPDSINQLSRLQYLNASDNRIRHLPCDLSGMTSLTWLFLERNSLSVLPEGIYRLPLQSLWLTNNRFTRFPEPVARMSELSKLHLADNPLEEIQENLHYMKDLELLDLSCCALTFVPAKLLQLPEFCNVQLSDNPLPRSAVKRLRSHPYIGGGPQIQYSLQSAGVRRKSAVQRIAGKLRKWITTTQDNGKNVDSGYANPIAKRGFMYCDPRKASNF
ncbi:MAG: leucine-rich repeat domain-containing protein [Exilibacterium sp.]